MGASNSIYVTGLVGYDNFGDDDCRHLAQLKKLQVLMLDGTKVTDAGLMHVKKLTGLTDLFVRGTGVTPTGVNKLRKSLPGCTITGP